MKWAKIFGIFVAFPLALVTAALAWFGISSISDIRAAASKADALLTSATSDLAKISKLQGDVQTQLDHLGDISRTNLQKISQLECRTRAIERNLGAGTAMILSSQLDPGVITTNSYSPYKQYGPFALNPQQAVEVASGSTAPWRGEFEGKKQSDEAFDAAWRAAAKTYSETFFEAQRALFKAKVYDPLVARIQQEEQVDLNKHSQELQELVLTWTALAGPGESFSHSSAGDARSGCLEPYRPQLRYRVVAAVLREVERDGLLSATSGSV